MSLSGPHRSVVSSALWRNAFCFRLCAVAFFTLSFLFPTLAQNIAVSDFRLLENDMTANLDGSTVYDQNGEKCALIRVETTQTGFTFENGALGVAKTVQKTGEIWVYVPDRTSRISIFHPQLGVLRNYDLGLSVRKARTYLLKLTSGSVQTVVHNAVTQQWLFFQVDPAHAVIEVEDEMWAVRDGTASKFVPFGSYNYRVQAKDYHPEAGRVTVNDPNNKTVVTVTLRPAFGWVEVPGSGDLSGADVYIDNQLVGQAPVKSDRLASGPHEVRIVKPLYKSFGQTVTVVDNETLRLAPSLSADFSTVTLTTDADAEIWVNGERKGSGSWTGPLQSGEYLFETRRENHRTASTTRTITAAQRQQTIFLSAPVPIYGSLNIATTPGLSDVLLDGTPVGQTPLFLPQVLIGNHTVTVRKANCGDFHATVSVAEGQTAVVEGELSSLTAVTLDCNAQGAQIWVDGTALGALSTVRQLAYGPHQVVLRAEGYNDFTGNITVTDADHAFKFTMTEKEGTKWTFTVKGVSFTMVQVAGGTFQMGATAEQRNPNSDEKPVHRVTLSSYYIGQTEVTQALWEAVMGKNPSEHKDAVLPVEQVSWEDCQTFIKKLNALTGQTFRLPTEAEWEYAARGGAKSKGYQFSGSNNLGEVAWYRRNSSYKTQMVRRLQANELGLYDMSGNVWEWCQDWYGSYSDSAQTNPQGPSSGSRRVSRGGGWFDHGEFGRVANRSIDSPGRHYNSLGLRLALSTINTEATSQITSPVSGVTQTGEKKEISDFGQSIMDGKGKIFTVRGVKFTMIPVEGGTFQMGATPEQISPYRDEKPAHRVTLTSYYIGQTEVTQALWEAVMGENPSKFKDADLPVERVSWEDCQAFIKKLNELTGQMFRLPTEAEWEYAARGGERSKRYQYSGSNILGEVAWYRDNSDSKTHAVGTKLANELGLYDMSGNVWEWCYDRRGRYGYTSQTNPQGPSSGSNRVIRGGSWNFNAWSCRVAGRYCYSLGHRGSNLGLRLAL